MGSSAAENASNILKDGSRSQSSTLFTVLTSLAVVVTVLAVVAAGIYFAGYGDDMAQWLAKKYYAAKAKAQIAAMGKMGSEKAEGMLKDSLKNNPVMGEKELDQVSSGLGKEATQEGLGGVSKKLGGLGKI